MIRRNTCLRGYTFITRQGVSMAKVAGWLASILATIIGGYVIWYVTRPAQMEGMIIDQTQNAPIEKALVTVEVQSGSNGPFDDSSDSNGSYGMELSGIGWRTTVTIRAKAKGYRDSEPVVFVVGPGGNRKDFFLVPESAATSTSGSASGSTAGATPGNSGGGNSSASNPPSANPNPGNAPPPASNPKATPANHGAANVVYTGPPVFVKKAFIQKYAVVKKQ